MDTPGVVSVQPLPDKCLLVTFANGVRKLYDCAPILALERFRMLRHDAFFRAVRVDAGGYGISWDDRMDLSETELWHNGVAVEPEVACRERVLG